MAKILRNGIVLLLLLTAVTGVAYPLAVTAVAAVLFPGQANGSVVERDGKPVGSSLIGQSFTTPYKPLVPAGTYLSDGESSCSTDYEQKIGDDFVRQHTTGRTLVLDRPARDLEPSAGSKPCTFRRTA